MMGCVCMCALGGGMNGCVSVRMHSRVPGCSVWLVRLACVSGCVVCSMCVEVLGMGTGPLARWALPLGASQVCPHRWAARLCGSALEQSASSALQEGGV